MSRASGVWNAPSTTEYVRALTALGERVTEEHRSLFRAHYHAFGRSATAKQLASLAGIAGGVVVVNALYGKLGHALCDELGISPEFRSDGTYQWWSVWFRGFDTPGGFVWEMRPEVVAAVEQLGWASTADRFVLPDELPDGAPLVEGSVCQVIVNAYERNLEARRQCIEAHGTTCCVCGFNFGEVYGPVAEGYIHVHHIRPISEVGEKYVVSPVDDLLPVCPNCHAVFHLGGRCRSVEEIRQLLATQRK